VRSGSLLVDGRRSDGSQQAIEVELSPQGARQLGQPAWCLWCVVAING
jgi:hypothetical protein